MPFVKRLARLVQPLERKLPLTIAGLLTVVIAGFGWLANRELRNAFETSAGERLSFSGQRLANLLTESSAALRTEVRQLAKDSAVIDALARPNAVTREAALKALSAQRSPAQPASRALFTKDCALVLSMGPDKGTPGLESCPLDSPNDAAVGNERVRQLSARHEAVYTGMVAPVGRNPSDTLGYLVQVRKITSPQGAQTVNGLIGRNASLMIGNRTAPAVWTDLVRITEGPPHADANGTPTVYTNAAGDRQIGVALNIKSTPWMVWIQMPLTTALAGQYQVIQRLAFIALACVLVGVLAAWLLSNHFTRPLLELKHAAEGMAAGDYSHRVAADRSDELGDLMMSFNEMAEQVQQANQELALQAEELEAHFREAQNLAHELELSNQELIESARETQEAERGMELAQTLLDEVITQAPVGIAVFDEKLRYRRHNSALADMNGVSIAEHIGKWPWEVRTSLGTMAEDHLRAAIDRGETYTDEQSSGVIHEGVTKHWIASYFPVRTRSGEIHGAGVVVLDTTRHHELEAQLLQAQKMDAVGRLAGGVAHDFNNLLTVITSYSELALESLSRDDELYSDMMEIRASADRASRLTRQLLAFSRKQVLQPQNLDLNRAATEMEKMLRRLIGEDVALVLDLARDLGEVRADPGQIEQVLMNLVLNARDAMPEGGRLVVRTANVTLSNEISLRRESVPPGDYVTLSVSDTGTGMNSETREHLFEPFFTTKGQGQGTGLGLSTVYGIVKQSGGDILVQSEPSRGSTFTIYLPRLARGAEHAVRGGLKAHAPYGGSETILLVEDDESLRALAQRILRSAGYTVLEARTANGAIELGENHDGEIHLLLTDVVMPQASGREVGARLSALRPGLRVLFMSGYNDEDVMKRGVVHDSAFLQKPFTPDELARTVREVLDSDIINADLAVQPRN